MTATEATTAAVEHQMQKRLNDLSEEQQSQLSKALFPSTHTEKVTLMGKERTLRPLTIKFGRQLNVVLQSFQSKIAASADDNVVVDIDLLDIVIDAVRVLATYYEWDDVKEALDAEDCLLPDLQGVVVQQIALQEANDFLLMPLRVLVTVMQQAEIEMLHLQNTFSGLRSSSTTSARLTN